MRGMNQITQIKCLERVGPKFLDKRQERDVWLEVWLI